MDIRKLAGANLAGGQRAPVRVAVARSEARFLPRFAGCTTRGAFAATRPPQVVREVRQQRVWQTSDPLEHGYHTPNVVGPGPPRAPGELLDPSKVERDRGLVGLKSRLRLRFK